MSRSKVNELENLTANECFFIRQSSNPLWIESFYQRREKFPLSYIATQFKRNSTMTCNCIKEDFSLYSGTMHTFLNSCDL